MKPDKEKHQMFADIHPKFGFPLAFRPKFQLNAILRRDTDIPMISNFPEQLVLPFLWAQVSPVLYLILTKEFGVKRLYVPLSFLDALASLAFKLSVSQ